MANDKKITVDQLKNMAQHVDEKFIDEDELAQAKSEIKADSYCKYTLTSSDDVVDVHGDGYAYQITVNADFSEYANHIYNGGAVWFDLSGVLGSTTLVSVTGFKVSAKDGGYVLTGDCTSMDVWYHFTLASTVWPSS